MTANRAHAIAVWLRALGPRQFIALLRDGYRVDADGRFTKAVAA